MKQKYKKVFFLFGLQLGILGYLLVTNNIFWYVCDDIVSLDIVSGAYGIKYPYAVNPHILLGYLWNILFSFFPEINWVTIFYLVTYVGAFLLLDFVFASKNINCKILSFFLSASFFVFISTYTFTVVAYCASIAGVVAAIYGIDSKNKKYLTMGILFLCVGILFRGEVVKSLLFFLLMEVFFHWKEGRKEVILLMMVSGALMYLGIYSNLLIETKTPIMEEYLRWGETRSEALDAPLGKYSKKYEEKGISEEQYFAMKNALYCDQDLVSLEALQTICKTRGVKDRYAYDIIQFVKDYFKWVSDLNYYNLFYILFYGALILCLINALIQNDKSELRYLAICLTTVCIHFVFYFIQRMPYHVLAPNYLCGMTFLLYHIQVPKKVGQFLEKRPVYVVTLISLIGVLMLRPYRETINGRQQVLQYLEKNNQTIYIAGDASVFGVVTARSIWDYTGKHSYANIMGNWEIYSEPYYDLMEIYKIETPKSLLLEAARSNKVKLITTLGDDFPNEREIILIWLKKTYGIEASFEKIDDIVSYGNEIPQRWAVYDIKIN